MTRMTNETKPAIGRYRSGGFVAYELDPAMGRATFFEKWLT